MSLFPNTVSAVRLEKSALFFFVLGGCKRQKNFKKCRNRERTNISVSDKMKIICIIIVVEYCFYKLRWRETRGGKAI